MSVFYDLNKTPRNILNQAIVRAIVSENNGAWFDPSDMSTLYQDAAGTIPVTAVEQPVGLMLDKAQGGMLGPELVSNGTFDSSDGWTIAYSDATHVATFSDGTLRYLSDTTTPQLLVRSNYTISAGKTYAVTVSVSNYVSGQLRVEVGGVAQAIPIGAGIKTFYVLSVTSNSVLTITRQTSGVDITLDNISVRELYGYHATQSITASRPTLSARYNLLTKTEDFSDAVWLKTSLTTQSAKVLSFSAGANSRVTQVVSGSGDFTITAVFSSADVGKRIQLGFWASGIDGISANGRSGDLVIPDSGIVSFTKTGLVSMTNIGIINSADGVAKTVTLRDGFGVSLLPTSTLFQYQRVNTATDYDTNPAYFPKYLRFDGIDDYLVLPYMGLYANGSASVVMCGGIPAPITTIRYGLAERNTINAAQIYSPVRLVAIDLLNSRIRDDTATDILSTPQKKITRDAFVFTSIDTGSNVIISHNGVLFSSTAYTRTSATYNNTTIGAGVWSSGEYFFAGYIYSLIITKSALTDAQRIKCERYAASKAGVIL